MTPAKEFNDVLQSQYLPLELRRAWTVHRSQDHRADRMLTGIIDNEQDEVISPHLLRQNLLVTACPFRAASPLPRATC